MSVRRVAQTKLYGMMFERKQNSTITRRYCHKVNNGYEFIADNEEMMFSLTKNVSTLNFQHYIYYMAVVCIKFGDGWVRTNETRVYNTVEDFVKELGRAAGFTHAASDYEDVKEQ